MVNSYKINNVVIALITFSLSIAMSSCNNGTLNLEQEEEQNEHVWRTAILNFYPILSEQGSRALNQMESYEPCTDDILVINFTKTGGQNVKGYAKYNMTTQQWVLTYSGDLSNCSNEKCNVIYIGHNPILDDVKKTVSFTAQSPLFDCNSGIYDCIKSGTINLYATLHPITSRVRFKGSKGTSFEMKGFGFYNKFLLSDWTFEQVYCLDPLSCNVSNSTDGYISPYYYVYSQKYGDYEFTKCDNLWIKEGNNVYLWKKKTSDYLQKGVSGLINLPSVDTEGWLSDSYRTKSISDITIKSETNGGWTQTQSQTRFYSNVGIQVNLTYTITSQGSQDFTSFPFVIGYWAYDENDNYLGSWDNSVHKDEIKLNKSVNYKEEYYVEGASYYEIQFYVLMVAGKITNFKIATF